VATAPSSATADASARSGIVTVPTRVHRRRGLVLSGLAVFQFWLWGTRIWNLVRDADDFSTAFVAVHAVLYVAAIGAGALLAVLGVRMWREAGPRGTSAGDEADGVRP
jgi:hypothetical protein